MNRPRAHHPVLALVLALALGVVSCDDEGPDGPPPDPDCIGPGGGQTAVSDSTHPLFGVSLAVAPGAWQTCWSVYFGYNWTFDTPNFPDGLEGYEGWLTGSLELSIGKQVTWETWREAPDSLPMELSFPLRDMSVEPSERLTAFRYDEEAGIYRLVLPEKVDDTHLTISTHQHDCLWTWGTVDLGEVDFDTYLAPVMEEMHGEGVWLEIQAKLDSLRQAAIEGQIEATCATLEIVRAGLMGARDGAADVVRAIQTAQAGDCGVCDATTPEFYDMLAEYCRLKVEQILTDLFLGNSNNLFLRLYGFIMVEYKRYCIEQLACDFECFADSVNAAFYYNLAIYYVSCAMVELIDWAMAGGYLDCW